MRGFRRIAVIVGLASAMFVAASGVTSAQAVARRSTVRAGLNHSVIHLGGAVVVAGYVSPNLRGDVVRVQQFYGGGWHNIAQTRLNAKSRFGFTLRPRTGGRYVFRVVLPRQRGVDVSAATGRLALTVQTLHTVTLPTISGTGGWQGPTTSIPAVDYTLTYQYACTDNIAPFVRIAWNGQPYSYESLWSEPPAGGYGNAGTWYGHEGGRSGYFDIGTQADCTWSFDVTYQVWS